MRGCHEQLLRCRLMPLVAKYPAVFQKRPLAAVQNWRSLADGNIQFAVRYFIISERNSRPRITDRSKTIESIGGRVAASGQSCPPTNDRSWRKAAIRRNVRSWGAKPTSWSHAGTSQFDPNRTSRYLKWTARRIASDISQRYGNRSRVAASRNRVHRGREESSSGLSLRPCEIFCSIRASTFAVTALS